MDRTAAAMARNLMVDGQVRPNKVTNARLIEAMRTLPREAFLPPALWPLAYADEDVPLGGGRAMMEPMVIARLLQLAGIRDGDRALVVGAGTGYSAALLDACGASVVALEQDPALLDIARPALAAHAPRVALVEGPLVQGWHAGAPYDIVLIEGMVTTFPPDVVAQLRPASSHLGGRLVAVRSDGGVGHGGLGEVAAGRLAFSAVFDCATPALPGLAPSPGFVF